MPSASDPEGLGIPRDEAGRFGQPRARKSVLAWRKWLARR
jgi:hypothetical protein